MWLTAPTCAARVRRSTVASPPDETELGSARQRLIAEHIDVTDYVVSELDRFAEATL